MFEIVEKHKPSKEEKKVMVLEWLAALAICGIIGVLLWVVFAHGGG
jgi:cytoskeletal protein RodZ